MNRDERINLLAQAHAQAVKQAEQERVEAERVKRISADVQAKIAAAAAKKAAADDDLEVECPYCHNTFSVDQRPSEETSETGQDDPDNQQDDDEGDWDNKVARVKAIIKESLHRIN